MNNDKKLENRINILEDKIDQLITSFNSKQTKVISREKFTRFYNTTKIDLPVKTGCIPICIWINKAYEEDMKKNLLYPSDTEDFWYLTGEINPIPISFRETIDNVDYYVDMRATGDFW